MNSFVSRAVTLYIQRRADGARGNATDAGIPAFQQNIDKLPICVCVNGPHACMISAWDLPSSRSNSLKIGVRLCLTRGVPPQVRTMQNALDHRCAQSWHNTIMHLRYVTLNSRTPVAAKHLHLPLTRRMLLSHLTEASLDHLSCRI